MRFTQTNCNESFSLGELFQPSRANKPTKAAIVEEWDKISQDVIDTCINAFKQRLKLVVENEGRHIER